jgi:hypothetical protein
MSCFLFAEDSDAVQKVNIDDLYERNQRRDQRQLSVFNKILNRINRRITTTSRMKQNDKYIWYNVPAFIFGEPLYDQTDCIAFVVTKLADNGFYIKYINPGTLFISWENWVPTYMRQEIRKKTGYVLDEKGNVVDKVDKSNGAGGAGEDPHNPILYHRPDGAEAQIKAKEAKKFTPIKDYKPTGSLIYGDAYERLEKRVTFK